jgi:glutamate synthase domain-containing protein 3
MIAAARRMVSASLVHHGSMQKNLFTHLLPPLTPSHTPRVLQDLVILKSLIQRHVKYTNSSVGKAILGNWDMEVKSFVKVSHAPPALIAVAIRDYYLISIILPAPPWQHSCMFIGCVPQS